jgi:hypothetical protein
MTDVPGSAASEDDVQNLTSPPAPPFAQPSSQSAIVRDRPFGHPDWKLRAALARRQVLRLDERQLILAVADFRDGVRWVADDGATDDSDAAPTGHAWTVRPTLATEAGPDAALTAVALRRPFDHGQEQHEEDPKTSRHHGHDTESNACGLVLDFVAAERTQAATQPTNSIDAEEHGSRDAGHRCDHLNDEHRHVACPRTAALRGGVAVEHADATLAHVVVTPKRCENPAVGVLAPGVPSHARGNPNHSDAYGHPTGRSERNSTVLGVG